MQRQAWRELQEHEVASAARASAEHVAPADVKSATEKRTDAAGLSFSRSERSKTGYKGVVRLRGRTYTVCCLGVEVPGEYFNTPEEAAGKYAFTKRDILYEREKKSKKHEQRLRRLKNRVENARTMSLCFRHPRKFHQEQEPRSHHRRFQAGWDTDRKHDILKRRFHTSQMVYQDRPLFY